MDGVTDSMDVSLIKVQKMVKDREAWRASVHGVTKAIHPTFEALVVPRAVGRCHGEELGPSC